MFTLTFMDFGSGMKAEQAVLPWRKPACRHWHSRGILKGGSFNSLIPVFLEGRMSAKASCDETLE